jgi:hypothetical protein
MGTVCGFNPNFVDSWSSSVPSTCFGLVATCQYTSGGVTYTAPVSITLQITSGYPTPLTAQIVNCPKSPSLDHGASCVPSNDSSARPLSHALSWGMPNGNSGPLTTLVVTQIGSSDATPLVNVPADQWPGGDILITDPCGNADIVSFSASFCSHSGSGPDTCQ